MKLHYTVPTAPEFEEERFLPLALVEVSHAKKLELLEKSSSASKEALPQTQDMLAHLREFQPSIAQMLSVKDIAISQAPLRLLLENSGQLELDSPSVRSYIALSYCWHGPDWEATDCLGPPEMGWPISTAMVHGLLNQRESPEEGLWIDQCCINQADPIDKQLLIGSMDIIYKCARKVVVILEDVSIPEAEEVVLQAVRVQWKPKNEDLDALARLLLRILSARWFQRAWCSHELQLSDDIVFLLPTKNGLVELSADDVEELYSVTSVYIERDHDLGDLMVEGIFRSYDFFTRTLDRKISNVRGRSLIAEFSDICQLACSVQTDILSIAINVSGLQVYFTGEIRSRNECRWVLSMMALCTGDANVLGGIDEVLWVEDRAGTPSWLNWVDDLENTMTRVGYSRLQESIHVKSIDQYQITLDVLDLTDSEILVPSELYFRRARLLVGLLSESYYNDFENQPYWMSPALDPITAARERRLVVEILACSFECGYDWMIEQMLSAPNLAEHIHQGFIGDFGSRFWLMLDEHVLVEDTPESSYLDHLDNDKKTSLLLYFYYILFQKLFEFGRDGYLPTTSLAEPETNIQVPGLEDDPRLFECMCFEIGLGNKALVAFPLKAEQYGIPCMPVALSNGSCAGIRRLWFLDSSPDDEADVMRLTGKYHMFTLIPIEENGKAIRRRDQVIRQGMDLQNYAENPL